MVDRKRILQAALRQDFAAFVHKTVQTVSPGDTYRPNWHIDGIAYLLTQAYAGDVLRLLITQPPRSLKSINTSVAFVAWSLGHNPELRFICVSYSNELSLELARQCRLVMESEWYKDLFPGTRLEKSTSNELITTKGGGRVATSIGGTLTGRGADYIIIDDPLKAEDAQSEAARRKVIDWYRGTLSTRLNNQREGRIIVVMQRLHEEDLAGHLIKSGEAWRQLNLPAIAEEDETIEIGRGRVHHRKKGEPLHAEREPLSTLKSLQQRIGSLAFSAQYQQAPVPLEGNLIKRDWFKRFDEVPADARVIQSWDLASSVNPNADYSACVTVALKNKQLYVIDVWRGRLDYPRLKKHIIAHALRFNAKDVLIEKAGPGLSMVQGLRNEYTADFPTPIGITVKQDKAGRLEASSAVIERGDILLPQDAPWLGDFLNELLAFPNGSHDDQADAFSQLINWYEQRHRYRSTGSYIPAILITADDYG
ncbi:MAG: phage terminase large subunit [Pseudomonadota bacterium]